MGEGWPIAVTALLASARAVRRRFHCLAERLCLLGRRSAVRAAGSHCLRIDARRAAGVEAADDDAVAMRVEQRDREALVATRVLERVEPHHGDPLERMAKLSFLHRRSTPESLDVPAEGVDALEMGGQDRLEAPAIVAAGDAVEPPAESAEAPGEDDHGEDEDETDGREAGNDRSKRLGEQGIDVDRGSSGCGARAPAGPGPPVRV